MIKRLRCLDPPTLALEFALLMALCAFATAAVFTLVPYWILTGQWKPALGMVGLFLGLPYILGDWVVCSILDRPTLAERYKPGSIWQDD